jgi:hypothetical protein
MDRGMYACTWTSLSRATHDHAAGTRRNGRDGELATMLADNNPMVPGGNWHRSWGLTLMFPHCSSFHGIRADMAALALSGREESANDCSAPSLALPGTIHWCVSGEQAVAPDDASRAGLVRTR